MRLLWAALDLGWVAIFVIAEGYALVHDDAVTLSRFTFEVSAAWPPAVFIAGLVVGMLAEHFWRFLPVGFVAPGIHPVLRYLLLEMAWLAVIVLTGGAPGIFLTGLAIGMAVTRVLWGWNPNDTSDNRG